MSAWFITALHQLCQEAVTEFVICHEAPLVISISGTQEKGISTFVAGVKLLKKWGNGSPVMGLKSGEFNYNKYEKCNEYEMI